MVKRDLKDGCTLENPAYFLLHRLPNGKILFFHNKQGIDPIMVERSSLTRLSRTELIQC